MLRQKHSDRPWEKIGISRSTWYRHGKPTEKAKEAEDGIRDRRLSRREQHANLLSHNAGAEVRACPLRSFRSANDCKSQPHAWRSRASAPISKADECTSEAAEGHLRALFWIVHKIDGQPCVRIQEGDALIFAHLNAMRGSPARRGYGEENPQSNDRAHSHDARAPRRVVAPPRRGSPSTKSLGK